MGHMLDMLDTPTIAWSLRPEGPSPLTRSYYTTTE